MVALFAKVSVCVYLCFCVFECFGLKHSVSIHTSVKLNLKEAYFKFVFVRECKLLCIFIF